MTQARTVQKPLWMLAPLAALGIISCQSTDSVDTASGAQDLAYSFQVPSAQVHPDSASWSVKTNSGDARLGHDSTTLNNSFTVAIRLPVQLGSNILRLSLWRNHMLTGSPEFQLDPDGNLKPIAANRDTLATVVLDQLDALHSTKPGAYPLDQDSSIAKAFAVILVQGDTLFRNWTKTFPKGIDTARARREALVYAAAQGQALSSITATWVLGMDLNQARAAILALMPQFIPFADTETLFPVPPVRATVPVTLTGTLYSDSLPVSVKGKFVAKKRLFPPSLKVKQAGIEVKNHFEFVQQSTPTASTTSWDLGADGNITLRAYGSVPAGTYTLVVSMEDGSYSDSSTVDFSVATRPDQQGPTLVKVSPSVDTSLSFKDSVVLLQVSASDSSGVKSLTLNGRILSKSGSVYQILDTLPPTGTMTDLTVTALDMLDNQSTIHFHILRNSSSTAKPTATLLAPLPPNDTLAANQAICHIQWRITDPVGILPGTVLINLAPATKVNDSTWTADVIIPPTGKAVSIYVQAQNQNNNGAYDSVVVVRRKDVAAPSIVNLLGTRTVLFDTTSAKVTWKVSDNLKVDSLQINGIPQVLRADSTYSFTIPSLAVDTNRVRIRVKDSTGNVSYDSQTITRLPNTTPPTLKRLAGTTDMVVPFGSDSVKVGWIASGNEKIDSVAINGRRALNSNDTFYINVATAPGNVPVVAKAWNLSKLSTMDSITISVKLRDKDGNFYGIRLMPDGRIWMTQNLKTLPGQGTSTCAMSNCNTYGATYTWSQAMGLAASYDAASAGYTDVSQVQGICPVGWHVPLRQEWKALFTSTMAVGSGDSSGTLRSDTGWTDWRCLTFREEGLPNSQTNALSIPIIKQPLCHAYASNGTNQYNNFLLPSNGAAISGTWASFWTAQDGATTTATTEYFYGTGVTAPASTKTTPSSVRCIQNQFKIIHIPFILNPLLTP